MTHSLIAFSLFLTVSHISVTQVENGIPIAPDAELQAKIDAAVRGTLSHTTSPVQRFAEVEKLRIEAEKQPLVFARQVLYYATNARDVSEGMAALGVFARFTENDRNAAIDAILPYIESDGSHGPRFRETIQVVLGGLEGSVGGRPPDFGCYTGALYKSPKNPPPALVRHMFDRDPSETLRRCIVVYGSPPARAYSPANEELRWADHIVNDAIKNAKFLSVFSKAPEGPRDAVVTLERLTREEATFQLEKLSKSDDWWVRLYVAEILRRHPAFGSPELIARLGADKHPLVREAMVFAAGKPEKPPKPGAPQSPSAPAKPPISKESTKGP